MTRAAMPEVLHVAEAAYVRRAAASILLAAVAVASCSGSDGDVAADVADPQVAAYEELRELFVRPPYSTITDVNVLDCDATEPAGAHIVVAVDDLDTVDEQYGLVAASVSFRGWNGADDLRRRDGNGPDAVLSQTQAKAFGDEEIEATFVLTAGSIDIRVPRGCP